MPVSQQMWGNTIWFLFHTILYKINQEDFLKVKKDIIFVIINVCNSLPCPECKEDANNVLKKINLNNINDKNELEKFIFNFHNHVKKKLNKKEFKFEDLKIYEKANINGIIHNFNIVYNSNNNVPQLMNESFHRTYILPKINESIKNILKYIN